MKLEYMTALNQMRKDHCPICESDDTAFDPDDSDISICLECKAFWKGYSGLSFCIWDKNSEEVEILNDFGCIEKLPEILNTLLNDKEILPIFMGIDPVFDKLIAERLKENE